MNRDEQEMALWAAEYSASRLITREGRAAEADAAVAEFRKRYPVEPTAPAPVWYDEPPFEKDGTHHPCWIAGKIFPVSVFWNVDEWQVVGVGEYHARSLRGRRVCPIVKPQEPTT